MATKVNTQPNLTVTVVLRSGTRLGWCDIFDTVEKATAQCLCKPRTECLTSFQSSLLPSSVNSQALGLHGRGSPRLLSNLRHASAAVAGRGLPPVMHLAGFL